MNVVSLALHLPFPSSNRTCGFPASGSPVNSRLKHSQLPTWFMLRLLLGFSVKLLAQTGEFLRKLLMLILLLICIFGYPVLRDRLILVRQAALLVFAHLHVYSKAPSLHGSYSASSLLWASPTSRLGHKIGYGFPTCVAILLAPSWTSQVPEQSVDTRHPQPPRGTHCLHSPVASTMVIGFAISGRLTIPNFCVTRPNQVRLSYGSHLRRLRLRSPGYPEIRSIDYMTNRQLS